MSKESNKRRYAMVLWNESMQKTVGVDHDGNESTQISPLGGYAMALGAPLFMSPSNTLPPETHSGGQAMRNAAAFLRDWADRIDAPNPEEPAAV